MSIAGGWSSDTPKRGSSPRPEAPTQPPVATSRSSASVPFGPIAARSRRSRRSMTMTEIGDLPSVPRQYEASRIIKSVGES